MDESIFHIFKTYLGVPAIENVHLQVFSTTIRQIIILEYIITDYTQVIISCT